MRYSLLAAFNVAPTLDDHLENLLLLGIGFLIIIFALIAGAIILDSFSKAFESSADWREHKSAKRKHRNGAGYANHFLWYFHSFTRLK